MLGASRAALIGVAGAGGDPYYSSTSLILQFEGSNGATTTTDESPIGHTITFNGNAQISTAQVGAGSSSLVLDGTGDYLTIADDTSLQLSGDFTIEFMMRPAAGDVAVLRLQENGSGYVAQAFYLDSSFDLVFASSSTGSTFDIAFNTIATSMTANVWQWIAVTRSGNTYSTYVGGTRTTTFSSSSTPISGHSSAIGATLSASFPYDGYIDQIRITKGVARYTGASYVVPTDLYPTS